MQENIMIFSWLLSVVHQLTRHPKISKIRTEQRIHQWERKR